MQFVVRIYPIASSQKLFSAFQRNDKCAVRASVRWYLWRRALKEASDNIQAFA